MPPPLERCVTIDCRTREKRRMKCVITEEKKKKKGPLCEWQARERHKDIGFPRWHSLSGRRARCQRYGKPCGVFRRVWGGSYRVGFKAPVSCFNLALAACNPENLPFCFARRVYKHPRTKRGSDFPAAPHGPGRGVVRCAGCEPKVWHGRWKELCDAGWIFPAPLGCECKVTTIINPFSPFFPRLYPVNYWTSRGGGHFTEGHKSTKFLWRLLFKEGQIEVVEQLDDSVSYIQVLVVKEVRVVYNYGMKPEKNWTILMQSCFFHRRNQVTL